MGIPHLKRHLRPYATCTSLGNREVVIDGPALAYHVLYLCRNGASRNSPFGQPSYSMLQDVALAWLDYLEAGGASISAIYFDGYLPESKVPERKNRLLEMSGGLRSYFASHRMGVPAGKTKTGQRAPSLFPSSPGLASRESMPVPAFTVPAVIDVLRGSRRYCGRTRLVPGEADPFCALHTRSCGGLILTSDSDLLVHDLGKGGVAFFADMESKPAPDGTYAVTVEEYIPSLICSRLSVPQNGGMISLAFELCASPCPTLEMALERARREERIRARPAEYDIFSKPYLAPEVVEREHAEFWLSDSVLDPRISELVLQATALPSRPYDPTTSSHDIADEGPARGISMYLPFLLDSPSRTSAWEASKGTRLLAYGILQTLPEEPPFREVIEFRRLESLRGGAHLRPPTPPSLEDTFLEAARTLCSVRGTAEEQFEIVRWTAFSVYQDIVASIDQDKAQPLSLLVLQRSAGGALDAKSWDVLHLLAEVHGTLYSLRMLKQVMDVVADRGWAGRLPSVTDLRACLSGLPTLDQFPQIGQFVPLLQQIVQSGCLARLALAFEWPDGIAEQMATISQEKRPKPQNARKKRPEEVRAVPRSNNPFDVLRAG